MGGERVAGARVAELVIWATEKTYAPFMVNRGHPPDRDSSDPRRRTPRICVVAPTPLAVIEISSRSDDPDSPPDVHMHPGGQGLWVARMAVSLGAEVVVCAPFGGEMGDAVKQMLDTGGLTIRAVSSGSGNGCYVYDLRGEDREILAHMEPAPLSRHELDDLYGTALVDALEADVLVVTGAEPASVVPSNFFRRLVSDIRSAGRTIVADLSGSAAIAAVEAGLNVLKVSHEEMLDAGLVDSDEVGQLRAAAAKIVADNGVEAVVVSRAEKPALLVTAGGSRLVVGPVVSPLEHRGAGDSMTAGIAVGLGRGLDIEKAVRLGAAAGTLNVTRRGLGTGRREQIERFADQIDVIELDDDEAAAPGEETDAHSRDE